MNDRERKQLDRIIAHKATVAREKLSGQMKAMFRRQAAGGMLASGNTIYAAVEVCGGPAEALMNEFVASAQRLHADLEAFAAIEAAIAAFFQLCREHMQVALGHALRTPSPSAETAAWDLFEKMRGAIESKLAIARFDFEGVEPPSAAVATPQRKNAGRLPAAFWDDLWASMAAGLYDGSLQPKSQADVERMMAEWIAANGFSAATSTIRLRAEKLWPLIAPDRR